MATMTLAELKKYVPPGLVLGVAEEIITTNPIYNYMPWTGFAGHGISVNKETIMGDAAFYGIGDTITSKTPSEVTKVLYEPTSVIGDAELNKLELSMSASSANSVASIEISSKAKTVGRLIQNGIATGTGVAPQMNSMHSMTASGQYVTGGPLTFTMLNALIDKVKSKDGQVDWIQANSRDMRTIESMYVSLGGVPMSEVQIGNRTVSFIVYKNIVIFQNDWLSTTETAGGAALTGGTLSSIYAGNWDDGSNKVGCAMIHPIATPAGIVVEDIGTMETRDELIYRIKAYANFASFNNLGLARLTDLDGTIA